MATLTIDDLNRLHRLAQLEQDLSQQEQLLGQLNHVFEMIQDMQNVDTNDVAPLFTPLSIHQKMELRLRNDSVTQPASVDRRDQVLRNAPATENGFFLVPKVIE